MIFIIISRFHYLFKTLWRQAVLHTCFLPLLFEFWLYWAKHQPWSYPGDISHSSMQLIYMYNFSICPPPHPPPPPPRIDFHDDARNFGFSLCNMFAQVPRGTAQYISTPVISIRMPIKLKHSHTTHKRTHTRDTVVYWNAITFEFTLQVGSCKKKSKKMYVRTHSLAATHLSLWMDLYSAWVMDLLICIVFADQFSSTFCCTDEFVGCKANVQGNVLPGYEAWFR